MRQDHVLVAAVLSVMACAAATIARGADRESVFRWGQIERGEFAFPEGAASGNVSGWRVSIAAEKDAYEVGEPVVVWVYWANRSKADQELKLSWPTREYAVEVQDLIDDPELEEQRRIEDESGHLDRRTRYYKHFKPSAGGLFPRPTKNVVVKPEEVVKQKLLLNVFWDMTAPMEYAFRLRATAKSGEWEKHLWEVKHAKYETTKQAWAAIYKARFNLTTKPVRVVVKDGCRKNWLEAANQLERALRSDP